MNKYYHSAREYAKWTMGSLFRRSSPSVSLFWWKGCGNVGDVVSPYLVAGLLNCKIRPARKAAVNKLVGCGSILHYANSGDFVWGSGAIRSDLELHEKKLFIASVRGPLTRKLVISAGISCPEVYGDPALLLPQVKPMAAGVKKKWKIGIVPHYVDSFMMERFDPSVKILSVGKCLDEFLIDLWSCERIVSSSLHGIIFAESYGIPADWVSLSDNVVGSGFKFRDYYLGTEREPIEPLRLGDIYKERLWKSPNINKAGIFNALQSIYSRIHSGE